MLYGSMYSPMQSDRLQLHLSSRIQAIIHRPGLSAPNKSRRNIGSYLGSAVRAILGNRVRVPPNDKRLEAGRTVLCHMNVAIA